MHYSDYNTDMKRILEKQMDPRGDIARSSFVNVMSAVILNMFVKNENEQRELNLMESTNYQKEEESLQPIKQGLSAIFNCLDINKSLVPASQIIAVLCLLSDDPIEVRLKVGSVSVLLGRQ